MDGEDEEGYEEKNEGIGEGLLFRGHEAGLNFVFHG